MPDIDLKAATPDTTLPTPGFLFGADSQAAASPSVYSTQTVATTLLGSTSLTGATITADAPVLNLSQTWNASGVTFTGLRFNATDTASASGSLLMDLQVGGSSILNVRKDGTLAFSTSAGIRQQGGNILNFYTSSVGHATPSFVLTSNSVRLRDNAGSYFIGGSDDVIFGRRAAANLRLGAADAAAPVAQTLSVQSVVAGTSNTAGQNFTITGSQGTGTGAGGSIIFQVAPAGSSGTAQNALVTALTIGTTNVFTSDLRCDFLRANGFVQVGGSSGSYISGPANDTFRLNSIAGLTVNLTVEANNTLALRDANNGQTFRLYGRFTDITNNFERFFINAPTTSGAAVQLGTQKGATTGAARALEFQTDGTTRLTIATNGDLTIADAENIILGSTTGTKIGTATTQKIGFYNATPVVQPTAVADATDAATVITQLNALLAHMRTLGLIAT